MSAPARHRAQLHCRIALPAGFRRDEMLAFHGRDAQGVAERVEGHQLHKGILWEEKPARLTICFGARSAEVELAVDGNTRAAPAALRALARRMLGLDQPVAAFERAHATHPALGVLIRAQAGLRVPVSPTPWEALSWAVTGQQISLDAAISLRRRLIRIAGPAHSSGLLCYPDAARVAALDAGAVRGAGFSRTKADTLLAVSRAIASGELPLDVGARELPVAALRAGLLAIRGIGPWTVDYALLRGFGYLDGSLHGDAAVRRKLGLLLRATHAPDAETVRRWLEPFSPWRALAAAHLWAMPANPAAAGGSTRRAAVPGSMR